MTSQGPEGQAETIRLCSLTEDTLVEFGDDGSLVVVTRWGEFDFPDVGDLVRESLRRMAFGPVSLTNVAAAVPLPKVLDRLSGSVVYSLGLANGGAPLLSAIPVTLAPSFSVSPVPAHRDVRLSRFASMRPGAGGLLLSSPTAHYEVLLAQPAAVLVASSLAEPISVGQVAATTGVPRGIATDVVAFLLEAGVAVAHDEHDRFAEDNDRELGLWTPDDLAFHTRSRTWRSAGPPDFAAVWSGAPPPVVKPGGAGQAVPLYRPAPASDPVAATTLTTLLESDHMCPKFTERPFTAEWIGELLYRSARVRSIGPEKLASGSSHEASQRPYFSVACRYELEIYVSVNRCTGLARGIYHYDPLRHTLTLVNDDGADLDALLDMATVASGNHRRPSVLLTMTARMSRLASVLGGAAYATTLVHVGALQQVLYLTAKAMGLAAHAVPVDASDRVDRALKLDWPAEVGVGECVLDFPA